ncbi:MAG: nuclease [Lentisphaerae bacterium]|jgi:ERCC4-type nuclease|nr:nuclease [Lentisphaerota bacterium]
MMEMEIIIDHREPPQFRELFRDCGHVRVEQLSVGDFRVNDRWVFERKTISDLSISIVDGRLFTQAKALLKTEGYPVVVLEGHSKATSNKGVSREAVQGAIITLSVFFGLPVLRALNPEETVRLVKYTVNQGAYLPGEGIFRGGYRPKGLKARRLYALQGLPHVGKKRARILLDHFSTIERVILADEEELAEVDGIGRLTAKAIRELVSK